MKPFLALIALATLGAAHAEDPAVRQEFEPIYAKLDKAGWTREAILSAAQGSLVVRGLDKKKLVSLSSILHPGAKAEIESADTLAGEAKTDVRFAFKHGSSDIVQRELHTWVASGDGWRLSEIKLVSWSVSKAGRTISSDSEKVLTDYEKSYGRFGQSPSSPRSRRDRTGRLSARAGASTARRASAE